MKRNPKVKWTYLTLEKEDKTKGVTLYPFFKDADYSFEKSNEGKKLRDLMGAGFSIVKKGGGMKNGRKAKKKPSKNGQGKKPIQQKEKNGKRGTRKRGQGKPRQVVVSMQPTGDGTCLTPYDMKKPSRENIEKAREAKESFAKLVGLSENKIISPPRINVFELVKALELGTDPIEPLEFRHEDKALPKIGIVIDNSGSCHAFSGAARCMGDAIIEACDNEVTVGIGDLFNFQVGINTYDNSFHSEINAFVGYLNTCDVIIYLGDYDGWYGGNGGVAYFASKGIKVIALSNHACNYGDPAIDRELSKIDNIAWVNRVDLKDIKCIIEAIELAIAEF